MKKKVSDQDVARFIQQIADKLLGEMDYDLRVAESQMDIAEKRLGRYFYQWAKSSIRRVLQKKTSVF